MKRDFLATILDHKRHGLAVRKKAIPLTALQRDYASTPVRDLPAALRGGSIAVIAEFKRRSPSRGMLLREGVRLEDLVSTYADHGAAALSILTDEDFFDGSDADLRAAREVVPLPVLRKDFVIDEYQVFQSRFIGADALLLIVRILEPGQLAEYRHMAAEIGLATLVEVHDAWELDTALEAGAEIVGVNNRDLQTFEVSIETCLELRRRVPSGRITVAESGIHERTDVERIEQAGFDAILVGESLICAPDPGAKLAELRGA